MEILLAASVNKKSPAMSSFRGNRKVSLNSPSAGSDEGEIFDNWITKKLLASRIGMSVSFVNKYMKEGLPFRRRGRSVRFRVLDVEEWLQRRFTQ